MVKHTRAVCALAVFVSLITTQPAAAQLSRLRPRLEERIAKHHGVLGVAIVDLKSGERLAIRGDEQFPSASVIKLPILLELFHQIERGPLKLSDQIVMNPADQKPGSGVLQFLSAPHQLSLSDAATFMIILSDNSATNLVIDKVAIPPVNARMDSLGYKSTKLHSKVFMRSASIDTAGSRKWGLGVTTPNDIADMLVRLYRGQIVSDTASKTMIGILKKNLDDSQIPRYLPADASVAHKTGALNASRHDCGIVFSPQRDYVICALTKDNVDQSWRLDNEAQVTIADLARITHEFMTSQK